MHLFLYGITEIAIEGPIQFGPVLNEKRQLEQLKFGNDVGKSDRPYIKAGQFAAFHHRQQVTRLIAEVQHGRNQLEPYAITKVLLEGGTERARPRCGSSSALYSRRNGS